MSITAKIDNADKSRPVVMVDDSEMDLDIGRRFYAYTKLENPFLAVRSGTELLGYLEKVKSGEAVCPAVVLLDVNMPVLSGFETLKRVREQNEFTEMPVIVMLTNSDNPKDIDLALELGANGFQAKHFEVDHFADFMRGLFA